MTAFAGTGRQRPVMVLRYWSELSEREIAEVLRVSRGTVKSTANRALAPSRPPSPEPLSPSPSARGQRRRCQRSGRGSNVHRRRRHHGRRARRSST
ncbi:sigma factor-like helix-turn-helix DNA-binding protein [Dactylosporangium sp. NPDC051541]|uniref:sigma factor-like helix-turn-helix DNA-binding protein n=1 Tax=Dactylosporangium sp. NPDC051541 TaxID=3363977 RepID=UPI00378CD396